MGRTLHAAATLCLVGLFSGDYGLSAASRIPASPPQMMANPPSGLLTPGTTTLALTLTTTQPTACKWGLKDAPYSALPHTFTGAGVTSHSTTLVGLSGTLTNTAVTVRCAAYPSEAVTLVYRCLPDTKATPFPRLGNLWGSGNFKGHPEGLAYAASRASLWLGSEWTAAEIMQLRKHNPSSIVLTSINACETTREVSFVHKIKNTPLKITILPLKLTILPLKMMGFVTGLPR